MSTITLQGATKQQGLQLDFAEQLKSGGQAVALSHAGKDWLQAALDALPVFLREKHGNPFALEEFRAWSESGGLPAPASANAWGSIPKIAMRKNLIRHTGRAIKALEPKARARLVMEWVAA
ncbi:MAG: hypothetical protein PSX71_08730 [bacterium]|nr:hypothetical protein [bacterium]